MSLRDGEPAEAATLLRQALELGVVLEPGQAKRLIAFEGLLRHRAVPMGLVARADAGRLRERHLLDCLRAVVAVRASDRDAYDLGSGAGLPGVVVALARPRLQVKLVEPRRKRASFLELAVEELRVENARVLMVRAEALRDPVDVCFARALSSAEQSFVLARPLLRPGGRLVYFAGSSWSPGSPVEGTSVEILPAGGLESAGPLVIMARQ